MTPATTPMARPNLPALPLVVWEMIRDFQPATSISSFSLPPSANQLAAKACRS
jgi:hypothetical protein